MKNTLCELLDQATILGHRKTNKEIAEYLESCGVIVCRQDELPTADVQPVKHGKWIATGRKNVYGGKEIECSECHFRVMVSPEHFENLSEYEAFCCHCGVKMEEE